MSDNTKKRLFDHKFDIVALILISLLFGYFWLFCDVVRCGDSFQYENQFPMREPVYSLLLQLLQIFPEDTYLGLLGCIQNTLAIGCTYFAYSMVCRLLEFKTLFRIGTLTVLLAPHILTPLSSKTHLVLTNTVMTEGIAVSLYYVWFTLLLIILKDKYIEKNERIIIYSVSLILALVLAMTRGQMLLCMVIWLIVVLFRTITDKEIAIKSKMFRITGFAGIVIVLLFAKKGLTRLYNQAETGYRVDTVSSNPMLLANIVYVCDEADAEFVAEDDMRETIAHIISEVKSERLSVSDAQGGLVDRARFHESVHETINFDIIDPAMRELIKKRYGTDESRFLELMIIEDQLCKDASKQLLGGVLGKYLKNYLVIASLGFIRSIAVEKSILWLFAVIMYLTAIAMITYLIKREGFSYPVSVMMLVLITICGTVLGTSIVIQCITRYMIYNFPFFYIACMGMLCSVKKLIKS